MKNRYKKILIAKYRIMKKINTNNDEINKAILKKIHLLDGRILRSKTKEKENKLFKKKHIWMMLLDRDHKIKLPPGIINILYI